MTSPQERAAEIDKLMDGIEEFGALCAVYGPKGMDHASLNSRRATLRAALEGGADQSEGSRAIRPERCGYVFDRCVKHRCGGPASRSSRWAIGSATWITRMTTAETSK